MLSTQTRSSRVAIWSRELMPTWYLKLPTPCLNIVSPPVCLWVCGLGSGRGRHRYAELRRDLIASARLHPGIGRPGVVDDLAHVGVEAEEAIGNTECLERVAQDA